MKERPDPCAIGDQAGRRRRGTGGVWPLLGSRQAAAASCSRDRDPRQGQTPSLRAATGFTLIELLVVLAIVALLATLAMPRYTTSLERAKQQVLVENLRTTREAIGKFYADRHRFPDSLQELVEARYLNALPMDPVLESDTAWRTSPPEPPATGTVADLHSGATGTTLDGRAFESL